MNVNNEEAVEVGSGKEIQHKTKRTMYFALKRPRNDISPHLKKRGHLDHAKEAEKLAMIQSKDIVQLCTANVAVEYEVMEKLEYTLRQKISLWQAQTPRGVRAMLCSQQQRRLSNLWNQRLDTVYSIADAMCYLHQKNILFRDLKPENIGFDANGTLKLSGLGFVMRDIQSTQKKGPDKNFSEEIIGTPRYMSPEVFSGHPHDKASDMYSFGLVAWEILSLRKPFSSICSTEELRVQVCNRQSRPKVNRRWHAELQSFLHRSWFKDPRYRPNFSEAKMLFNPLGENQLISKDGRRSFPSRSKQSRVVWSEIKIE